MIKILRPLPKNIVVALSGGVDSVAVCDFLSRKHNITAAFYHHGTENSERAWKFVAKFCTDRNIPMIMGMLQIAKPSGLSDEEWWRESRYHFLHGIGSNVGPVITAHNLDDVVETYLWSTLHGNPKTIPYHRNNIIRPFLTTLKSEFVDWCVRKNVEWCEDTSNTDLKYTRNYVRHQLMPHALHVNPGLHKVVRRIVETKLAREMSLQNAHTTHEDDHCEFHVNGSVSDDKLHYQSV